MIGEYGLESRSRVGILWVLGGIFLMTIISCKKKKYVGRYENYKYTVIKHDVNFSNIHEIRFINDEISVVGVDFKLLSGKGSKGMQTFSFPEKVENINLTKNWSLKSSFDGTYKFSNLDNIEDEIVIQRFPEGANIGELLSFKVDGSKELIFVASAGHPLAST